MHTKNIFINLYQWLRNYFSADSLWRLKRVITFHHLNIFPMSFRNKVLQKGGIKDQTVKTGIIVTYHNNAEKFTTPCLNSLLLHTPQPRLILAYDNESTENASINLPAKFINSDIKFIRIEDQMANGGLTGTWNQGIKKCIEENCDVIILLNYDTVVDDSWKIFISSIQNPHAVYAPVSNSPGANFSRQEQTKEYSLKSRLNLKIGKIVNGFCMGFKKEALISNMFDETHYFDPKLFFKANEMEWQVRFEKIKGKSIIVDGAFVIHHRDNAWKKFSTDRKNEV